MASIIMYSCLTLCIACFYNKLKKLIFNLCTLLKRNFQIFHLMLEMLILTLYLFTANQYYKYTLIGITIVSLCIFIYLK
ncbi:hypothetical protein BCO_0900105 (plasmid) [Borrelia coriaceae ATCC 43381]|uniref:Uncharacterized protein n=1 Tax=Borrelia coriaceae ATCC 43381 TaxID=1408429 RepID=W5SY05_9SPIR|nr:hypothetical protein BCO_0900105 [Borrelia coriaceae ATCC 43381]